jgi:hypothetical protein
MLSEELLYYFPVFDAVYSGGILANFRRPLDPEGEVNTILKIRYIFIRLHGVTF